MADGLFGVPTGLRAYQDDQIKLKTLANSTALIDAQVRNFDTDNKLKQDEFNAKQQAADDAKLLQAELARIAAGGSPTGGTASAPTLGGGSQFDRMLEVGQRQASYLLATGRVAEATKMLPALTNGVKDLLQARQAASAAKENEYDVITKRHVLVSQALSGATDQTSYDAAKMQLGASGALTKDDLAEMPAKYSPTFVRAAIAGSAAAKQKADLEREASRTATQNANDRDQISNRKLVRDLEERKASLAEQREARLEKQGEARIRATADKPLPPASAREIEVVRGELKRIGLKVGSNGQADLVADIAEQVKTLLDANPGLSRSEAASRIVAEMKQRGELEETWTGGNRYKPKEGSVTMPLPTPKTAAELKKGHYYLDAEDGLVKLFDGKSFKVSTKRRRTDVTAEE